MYVLDMHLHVAFAITTVVTEHTAVRLDARVDDLVPVEG